MKIIFQENAHFWMFRQIIGGSCRWFSARTAAAPEALRTQLWKRRTGREKEMMNEKNADIIKKLNEENLKKLRAA